MPDPKRVLTEEDIEQAYEADHSPDSRWGGYMTFSRAIESAVLAKQMSLLKSIASDLCGCEERRVCGPCRVVTRMEAQDAT